MKSYLEVVFASALLLCSAWAQEQNCFHEGRCNGNIVGSVTVPNQEECLKHCNSDFDCNFFTFFPETDICQAFDSCDMPLPVDPTSPDSVYGDAACVLTCFLSGTGCRGHEISAPALVATATDCLELCHVGQDAGCQWWNFDEVSGICTVLQECNSDHFCTTCVIGEEECAVESALNHLWVIGGHGEAGIYSDVELVDMVSNVADPCHVQQYPVPVHGAVGTLFYGKPIVCGGSDDITTFDLCFEFEAALQVWIESPFVMINRRVSAAAALVGNGRSWWVTGGNGGSLSDATDRVLSSVEIRTEDGFATGPSLPQALHDHCIVSIDEEHFFVAGGLTSVGLASNKAYILDLSDGDTWRELPGTLHEARYGHVCQKTGEEIVIAGGNVGGVPTDSVERFQIASEDFILDSERMPKPTEFAAATPFQAGFLVIGGLGAGIHDEIYQYRPSYEPKWHEARQSLRVGRYDHVVVNAPGGLCRQTK